MGRYQDEDERERISWREIDRRKDRSPHAPKEELRPRQKTRRSEWLMKKFRKEADKLFMGKKGSKEHQKAHSNIDLYYGTEHFEEAVKTYIDQYGLPDDWNTLSLILDHPDSETVIKVLSLMKDLYPSRTPVEQQGFKAKVDILAMTSQNSEIREFAEEVLKAL